MYQPHYRDRLCQKLFTQSEFKTLFESWEGGHLVMWRWSSLVDCLRALKRRQGPLQSYWDEKIYSQGSSSLEDENRSRAKAAKVEHGSGSTWSKGDAQKFTAAIKDPFFWAYLVPLTLLV